MNNYDTELSNFLDSTCYTKTSEFKKLKFIYESLKLYSLENNVAIKDINILEVACGRGGITLPLASLGCQVKAFDIDPSSIKSMNKKGLKNLEVVVGDAYKFYDAKKYDIIIASEVIHLLNEPEKFLENIKKSLHANSYLIITTTNGYGPWEISNRLSIYKIIVNKLIKLNILRKLLNKPPYVEIIGAECRQYFTMNRLLNLFTGMDLVKFGKSDSLLAFGSFSLLYNSIGKIDIQLADVLPYWLASGWYFTLKNSYNIR